MQTDDLSGNEARKPSRWLRILSITAAVFVAAAVLSAWWIRHNLYASPFVPTKLNGREQQVLDAKIDLLEQGVQRDVKQLPAGPAQAEGKGRLEPEPYMEDDAKREIRITEKELNALIAKDEETGRRVAVDLSRDMVSVRLLIPVDSGLPVLGGKTLRLNCGVTVAYRAGKPVVAVRGVSIGGVPIPNAWLGNIKNMDLVQEFGDQGGFWDIFSRGVADIRVSDGSFFVRLKE